MLIATSLLIVLYFGQDFHAALDVRDGGAVAASHRLMTYEQEPSLFTRIEYLPRGMQTGYSISSTRRLLVGLVVRVK